MSVIKFDHITAIYRIVDVLPQRTHRQSHYYIIHVELLAPYTALL